MSKNESKQAAQAAQVARKAEIAAKHGMTIAEYEAHMRKESRKLTAEIRKEFPYYGRRYIAPGKGN